MTERLCKNCEFWKQKWGVAISGECTAPSPFWVYEEVSTEPTTEEDEGYDCIVFMPREQVGKDDQHS